MSTPLDPVDETHAEAIRVRHYLREQFRDAQQRALAWEPRPMPENWGR